MISWNEDFRLGVKEIDEQHMQLFDIAGRAYELLRNDMQTDKYDGIIGILEELKEYALYHFKFEEDYMASIAYGKFLSHKVLHDAPSPKNRFNRCQDRESCGFAGGRAV